MPDKFEDLEPFIFGPSFLSARMAQGDECTQNVSFTLVGICSNGLNIKTSRELKEFLDSYYNQAIDIISYKSVCELSFEVVLLNPDFLNLIDILVEKVELPRFIRHHRKILQLLFESSKYKAKFHCVIPKAVNYDFGTKYSKFSLDCLCFTPYWCGQDFPYSVIEKS